MGPSIAAQLFEMWNIVTHRRISRNQSTLGTNNVERKKCFEAASRNVTKARFRLGLEQVRVQAGSEAVVRGQGGNAIAEPSGDEFPPSVSD